MAPPKPTKKSTTQKKEKLFHPQSRKADQLVREQHRKSKMVELAKSRTRKQEVQVDLYSFFYAAIPQEGVLTLADLHTIIQNVWLPRYDAELEAERKARRKGRPKSTRELKIEELKLRESEEYRTGLEVIDLTNATNVELFRRWDQKEPAYIGQLRFIRISSSAPEVFTVSRPGLHPLLAKPKDHPPQEQQIADVAMDEDEAPLLLEPKDRFSSTITGMDEIPTTS